MIFIARIAGGFLFRVLASLTYKALTKNALTGLKGPIHPMTKVTGFPSLKRLIKPFISYNALKSL